MRNKDSAPILARKDLKTAGPKDQATVGPDLKEANRFLAMLGPDTDKFCLQTYDDNLNKELKNNRLSWHLKSKLDAKTVDWLKSANKQGAAVVVAVNETDGRGRKKANVTFVRALLLDLDGKPLEPVKECALKPHIITETSPGHYHVLWRVNGLPLRQFEDVQRGLAKLFDGDPAVATLERCTRLPGFFNCKDPDNRFRVRIVELNNHDAFSADDILAEFPPLKQPHRASRSGDRLTLPAGAPLVAAEEFVNLKFKQGEDCLLWHYRGAFYRYTGTHYQEYQEETLERDLYAFLKEALVVGRNGTPAPFNPTKGKVQEIVHALRRGCLISPERETPCWLKAATERGPTVNLVACRNGILNLETRALILHDPTLFTTNCLPLDYDATAEKPKRWRQFLAEIWPDDRDGTYDKEAEDTLQEIFGYLLTEDTRQQKIFLLIGPPRSGKGTIVYVLEQLLGKQNCVYPTLSSFTGEFGRWPLIDKKLAAITDARISSKADTHRIAELLLSISGGDRQTINRKNQPFWSGYLTVRFLITTNVSPTIRDASGTITTRYVLLKLTESFLGREDQDLKDKLIPELGGILNWALTGLDRLRKRGFFLIPHSSKQEIKQLEDAAEPVKAFIREWCKRGPNQRVNVKKLYRSYRVWAEDAGHRIVANNTFGGALRAQLPKLDYSGVGAKRTYIGVALSEDGENQYDALLAEKGRRE